MWEEIAETFERALEVPPSDRDAWLAAACAGRDDVRREVAAMLAAHEPLEIESRFVLDPNQKFDEGTRLGNYRVLRWLGDGGMGEVYLGAREDFEQFVAIKVLRVHVPDAAARFRRERRILANLTHPAVVPLLDSGIAPDGRPYIVLQFVDGVPITTYCDEKKLDRDARLRLFVDVCRAVQYAHGRLIIHRDLKPSNILVTAEGEARLLDFGIAKALAAGEDEETQLTRREAPMTPERAAPEQLRGEVPSTATDVWALGVLLYELLTGRLPFDVCGRSRSEIERAITAGTEPARLGLGDIDTVVSVALRREPEQRYASAGQLADDVERVLAGQPILAKPHSLGYRIRRFVGRNRAAVVASALTVTALVAFSIAMFLQSRELERERDRAAAEQVKANAVVDLLVEILGGADPAEKSGQTRTIRVEELLARGEKRAKELAGQPEVQARLWHVLGKIQAARSDFAKAHELLSLAAAHSKKDRVAEVVVDLADLEWHMGRHEDAKVRLRREMARFEDDPASDKAMYASLIAKLALVTGGADGEQLVHRALAIRRELEPPQPVALADSLSDAAMFAGNRGEIDEAVKLWRESLALLTPVLDPGHPFIRSVKGNLAIVSKDADEQVRLFSEVIRTHEQQVGTWSEPVAIAYNNLGVALATRGDHERALEALNQALTRWKRVVGPEHRQSHNTRGSIVAVLDLLGRRDEAIAEMRSLREAIGRASNDPIWMQVIHTQYALLMLRSGDLDEAERWYGSSLAELRRFGVYDTLRALRSRVGYAQLLLAKGNLAAAEAELRAVVARYAALVPANDPRKAEAEVFLGRVLLARGKREEARVVLERGIGPFETWGLAHRDNVDAARRALAEARMSGTAP